jgi:hypothetical protein
MPCTFQKYLNKMGCLAVSAKYSHAPLTEWPSKIHWSVLTKEQKKGLAKALGVVLVALTKEELGDDEFDECLQKSIKHDALPGTTLETHTVALRSHYWNKLPWEVALAKEKEQAKEAAEL